VVKVLFCSGKIFYELLAEREKREAWDTAIVRIEQLYPWPEQEVEAALWRYPSTAEIVWVQEEPRNQGAYLFVRDRLEPLLAQSRRVLRYAGRPEAAATSTGSAKRHAQEQAAVLEDAFSGGSPVRPRRYRVVEKRRSPVADDSQSPANP